eukprot:6177578-Pleurochrysis_carterae.AAC.2
MYTVAADLSQAQMKINNSSAMKQVAKRLLPTDAQRAVQLRAQAAFKPLPCLNTEPFGLRQVSYGARACFTRGHSPSTSPSRSSLAKCSAPEHQDLNEGTGQPLASADARRRLRALSCNRATLVLAETLVLVYASAGACTKLGVVKMENLDPHWRDRLCGRE